MNRTAVPNSRQSPATGLIDAEKVIAGGERQALRPIDRLRHLTVHYRISPTQFLAF
jgi:hypothetical protein